jgi:hypothetical protein
MRLNHLFFANESLLFCKANILEWVNIQGILKVYDLASRQKITCEKTSIFFIHNNKGETKQHILSIARVSSTSHYETYGKECIPCCQKEDGKGSSSNPDVCTKLWKIVWNTKVLAKKKRCFFGRLVTTSCPKSSISIRKES